jgi:hypothetical protein
VLFATGYLTGRRTDDDYELVIPNNEIRSLFVNQIKEWFRETSVNDTGMIEKFCEGFQNGETEIIEQLMKKYLRNSISIRDTAVRSDRKENFYHGMLLGLLEYRQDWLTKSNVESGEGYSDILIETSDDVGVVIEIKYAQDGNMEKACRTALEQIENKQYDAVLKDDGMNTIIKYGIAFYKKNCMVVKL